MGTYQRRRALLSLSAVVAALVVLGFAFPEFLGLAQGERANKVSPAVHKADAARQGVAERPNALTKEEGGSCCAQTGGACCSAKGGKCACASTLLAKADPADTRLVALNQEVTGKELEEMMKKISPESKAKGTAARKALLEHQKSLTGDDVFNCCLKVPCAFCSNSANMCPCGKNVAKGEPVCPECWGGWQVGKGGIPRVRPEDVKVLPKSKLKMMYDMKEKNYDMAEKGEKK